MRRDCDYIVELGGRRFEGPAPRRLEVGPALAGRPWLAVHWKCCHVYSRIYRNAAGSAYDGRCPRCGLPVHVTVAPHGTSARFFEAY